MATIHIPEAEAARNFAEIMARAREGVEVIIEDAGSPSLVLKVAEESPVRLLSESLRMAREHGSTVTLDPGFSADLEAVINSHRQPLR